MGCWGGLAKVPNSRPNIAGGSLWRLIARVPALSLPNLLAARMPEPFFGGGNSRPDGALSSVVRYAIPDARAGWLKARRRHSLKRPAALSRPKRNAYGSLPGA